jgi:DNA-binding transcriptional LysR family regulator
MIDPRRLTVLAAVASAGSVSGAAASLHLTPPAVSQQLLALERETGVPVLDRSGRQATLTAAGRLLAGYAERLGTLLSDAERELAELTGRVTGPVRLAAFQSVMGFLVAPALRELATAHPGIHVSVAERYGEPALTDLRRGDLDIVLTEYDTEPAEEPSLDLHELAFDPYRLVVPREWRVSGLRDLDDRPWVAGPPGTSCDHALQRLVRAPAIGDVCVEFPSVLALVSAGRGAAIVPASTLAGEPVTVCPAPDLGGRHIAALCRRGPSPAVAIVLAALRRSPSGTSARPTTRPGS